MRYALKHGMSCQQIHELSGIDPWFLDEISQLVEFETQLRGYSKFEELPDDLLRQAKQFGFSDRQLGTIFDRAEIDVREFRKRRGIVATFKAVDTCAGEFEAYTPYFYSTYED